MIFGCCKGICRLGVVRFVWLTGLEFVCGMWALQYGWVWCSCDLLAFRVGGVNCGGDFLVAFRWRAMLIVCLDFWLFRFGC